MTMKHFRTFWLLLTLMMVGSFTLTSCVDNQDNPSGGGGGGDKDKNYVERLVPVRLGYGDAALLQRYAQRSLHQR